MSTIMQKKVFKSNLKVLNQGKRGELKLEWQTEKNKTAKEAANLHINKKIEDCF